LKNLSTLTTIILLFIVTIASAQNTAEDEFGTWYILSTNNKMTDNLTFNLQSQVRTYELASEIEQFKIRTSLNYQFTDKVSGALGYAYFRTDPSYLAETPQKFTEHRLVLDVFYKDALKSLNITHRYRAEQRLFNDETTNDDNLWLRYMLKLSHPITEKLSVDVYDEIFLNTTSPVFAQNWLGAGLTYAINKDLRFRAGYQKISLENQSFDRLVLSLNLKTDFRTSKN